MAYIEKFTIRGLAGREGEIVHELDRHINIFWGLNGSGKTSLLKILDSALKNDASLLIHVPFQSAEVVFWSTDHDTQIRRTITKKERQAGEDEEVVSSGTTLVQAGEGTWREVSIEPEEKWQTESLGSTEYPHLDSAFRHTYLPISRMTQSGVGRAFSVNLPQRRVAIDDAFLDEEFADQVRRKWQAYNSEALGSIRSIQQQGLASILALLFGGVQGSDKLVPEKVGSEDAYFLVKDFLKEQGIVLKSGQSDFVSKYDTQPDLRGVVANIQEVSKEVEIVTRPQQEFQNVVQNLYSGGKQLFFDHGRTTRGSLRVEQKGVQIPLQSLSSGEKQLLRLMLETLAAEECTVMIDEPELSMHVDWQQVLVQSMRRINPDCQLLLATHSPEVMADVPENYIFEL